MSFAVQHASALSKVQAKGAALTLSKTTQGSYDPETDTATASTATIAGYAVEEMGNPRTYQALNLVESQARTLFFVPSTYGDNPEVGSTLTWGGALLTVRSVQPLSPDGTIIAARIVAAE